MRIVAGKFRGRTLAVPDTKDTRPTMDRTRQAVFNILRSASWALKNNGEPVLYDARVMDAFAGSGAMGFEALSQGAAFCTFIDHAPLAAQAIQKNIDKIGLKECSSLIKAPVAKIPAGEACQLAFFDPPYHENLLPEALKILQAKNYIDASTLLVLEMHKQENLMDVQILDERMYGMSKIIFAKLD
jgi:16S rRNA (guanine966-N2)-methyltransferase